MERVGLHDNFFDLGGHSLLVMQVQGRLRRLLEREIPIVDLFRYPTVSALGRHLRDGSDGRPQPATEPDAGREPRGRSAARAPTAPAPDGRRGTLQPMSDDSKTTGFEIAIVGMAGRFPRRATWPRSGGTCATAWSCLSSFSDEELRRRAAWTGARSRDPGYVRAGGVLDDPSCSTRPSSASPRATRSCMDPQQRFFLECAWEALEDAGYDPERYPGRVGVFAGAGRNTYLLLHLLAPATLEALRPASRRCSPTTRTTWPRASPTS